MTTADLIKALQQHPPEARIFGWWEDAGSLHTIETITAPDWYYCAKPLVLINMRTPPEEHEQPPHSLNLKGRLAAAQAEIEILRDQIKEEREAPHYQVERLGPFVRVEVRLPHDHEQFPSMLHGFSCTPRDWDAMIASSYPATYIEVMGVVLAEDPHFAKIRDKIEPLLLKEYGPRTTEGRADYKEGTQ